MIPAFLLGCNIVLMSAETLASSAADDINIENIEAPHRDVKDILKLVEQTKPDLAIVERAKKVMATPLPVSQDNEVMNHFYTRRSRLRTKISEMLEKL
ncbi:hypothetical protein [Polynucleobacter necessarius]|uniref:hypothetical protein n=1 Tax=Polynucleobacter necessarius TaxID=576610 RepID=UPI000E09083E|nr:hypothetical protein [Polynucleobacter necessarius]HAT39717.1 hypothetical protein [Polynucleobacter sp.]